MRLVPVDNDPFADAPAAPATGPRLVPVEHDPFGPEPSMLADVANSAGAGLIRGAAGLPDLPQTMAGLANAGTGWLAKQAARAILAPFGEKAASDRGIDITRAHEGMPSLVKVQDLPQAGAAALAAFEGATGKLYEPQTTAGKFARTAAEFVPGAGRNLLAFGVLPGLASEGAGQALEGTAIEGPARVAAGLLTGGAAAGLRAARPAGNALMREALDGFTPEQVDAAGARMRAGAESDGTRLTFGEALNRETGGRAVRVSQLERVAANSPGGQALSELYAARPEQVDQAGRRAFDAITPPTDAPSALGLDVQDAAHAGLMQTAEGQALTAAREAAGPRVTPLQAGETIQSELRGVLDRATQQRDRQAAVDYAAARAAPERFGVDRTVTVERPGEPALVTLDPGAAPPPRFAAPADGGPATIGSLAPQRQPVPPRDPDARSLSRYIAENGGIGLERGDVQAAGLDRWRQPGVGSLVRQDGRSIDGFWRENLIERGYLPPDADGGMARNVHDEILNLLQQEQRGQRVYPYDWAGNDERSGFSRLRDDHQAAASRATADIRAALTEAGIDPRSYDKGVLDRAAAAVMRGDADPLTAVERAVIAAREPTARPTAKMEPTTIREEVPAPLFGQVDPGPAAAAVEQQLRTAKGDVRSSLRSLREDLKGPDLDPATGQSLPDMSVEGLLHARERADYAIADAQRNGDGTKVRDLQIYRSALDAQLKRLPEVATADANFAANSRAIDPFDGNTPLARATARDDRGRMQMPAEQVPGTLAQPSAARDLVEVATPAARQAQEARLTTEILDSVTDQRGIPDAGRLRKGMLEREDTLAQFPGAREALSNIVAAREGMARVEASPLGRLALQTKEGRDAARILFPANPAANSAGEVSAAVSALARNNPQAARHLVRQHIESVFNEATQDLRGLPAQYGGAGFASALRGNPQQAQNLEAAVRSLPEGDTIWTGLSRFLDTMEATGYRPQKGSDTAFNHQIQAALKNGGDQVGQAITDTVTKAAAGAAAGGLGGAGAGAALGIRKAAGNAWAERRMEAQVRDIARLLTDPAALPDLRALVASPPGSPNAAYFARRLSAVTNAAHQSGDRKAEPKR
ncbi:hypothetical protein [Methylobacterium nonmethylotrophicum]|uniref:hypothetical protein n=1 Tax=Methylobacterium nonmethylotrophicum TaxID=1141884 RepID=UPI001436C093|nr:hypothetical protein [Methylobacterium nonmethylotrophicum]